MCAKKRTFCKAKILYALVSAEPQFNKHQVKISPQQIPISDESDDKNNSIINMSDWKKEKKILLQKPHHLFMLQCMLGAQNSSDRHHRRI